MRRILPVFLIVMLFPYIVTLALSKNVETADEMTEKQGNLRSGKKIYLDGQSKGYVDVEEYLIGVLAGQIPADYELEAIKAQAIIARTYIYRQMKGESEIMESELNIESLKEGEMEILWGDADFVEYYEKMRGALEATAGKVIFYDGELIEPLFHRISVGKTRNGDKNYPYLESVPSRNDTEAENFTTVLEWTPADFADRLNKMDNGLNPGEEQIMDTLQLVKKDEAGYVEEIQIGAHIYTGDEIRKALELPSSAFSFKEYEGNIQAVCKGVGHGYGLSQYGANRMAEEGSTAEEILNYYYKNITINFE